MKPLSRRSVMAGSAAVVAAMPAVAYSLPSQELSLEQQVRSIIAEIPSSIAAREWVERKRKCRTLQALLGDPKEAWVPWELHVIADERQWAPRISYFENGRSWTASSLLRASASADAFFVARLARLISWRKSCSMRQPAQT